MGNSTERLYTSILDCCCNSKGKLAYKNIFKMQRENENQAQLISELINQVHNATDIGNLKTFLLEIFSDAQMSPLCGITPQHRYENFYNFKHLYNMLLKLEMYLSPDITGVNTLE